MQHDKSIFDAIKPKEREPKKSKGRSPTGLHAVTANGQRRLDGRKRKR